MTPTKRRRPGLVASGEEPGAAAKVTSAPQPSGTAAMVGASYLVDKPAGPSAPRRFFNQRILPPAIDAAAKVEAVAERAAQGARRSPLAALGIAFGIGFLASTLPRRA
jgi:hypothetical protein